MIARRPPFSPTPDHWIALALTVAWSLAMLLRYWGQWGGDLSAVYMAGHFWSTGQAGLIYAAPENFFGGEPPQWLPEMAALGIAGRDVYPYVYPPLWAVLAAPLADWLGPIGFNRLGLILDIALLAGCVPIAARLARPARLPLWAFTATCLAGISLLLPGQVALHFLQPSILTTFLTLLAIERMSCGHDHGAGIALGLAAALKISPAIFLVLFVIERRWQAVSAFAVTAAVLGALSLALAGPELHLAFLAAAHEAAAILFYTPSNASLGPALLALGQMIGLWQGPDLAQGHHYVLRDPPALIGTLRALGLGATLCALGWARARSGRPLDPGLATLALSITIPLFGPLGWMHYYLVPMLLLPALAQEMGARRAALPILLATLILTRPVGSLLGEQPWPASFQLANAAIWLGLLLLVLARLATAASRNRVPAPIQGLRWGNR